MQSPGDISHFYAATLLVAPGGKLIGQLRDDKPGIDDPGKIGLFGGSHEPSEDPQQAAWRELVQEETNLKLKPTDLKPFWQETSRRPLTNEWQLSHFFVAHITEDALTDLKVYEGQGWAIIAGPNDPNLADILRPVVRKFFDEDQTTKHQRH